METAIVGVHRNCGKKQLSSHINTTHRNNYSFMRGQMHMTTDLNVL